MGKRSIVEYFAEHDAYSCGYCKSGDTSYSLGMWGHVLTPQDYQDLINRGWRRSGKYCYKPTMCMTCCPQYTIRCEALKFKLSKSQKKVLKKFRNFLIHGRKQSVDGTESQDSPATSELEGEQPMDFTPSLKLLEERVVAQKGKELCLEQKTTSEGETSSQQPSATDESHKVNENNATQRLHEKIEQLTPSDKDTNSQLRPCRKAKELRRERRLQKLLKAGISPEDTNTKKIKCPEKSLEEFLYESSESQPKHKFELRLVPADLNNPAFSKTFEESLSVYQKYQINIHNDAPDKCCKKQFMRFLVNNPFESLEDDSLPTGEGQGSYHHQYWIDDKLIAVGVLDVLPHCVSSVYLYYDPDYSFLSLGTYSALREIALVRELHKIHPDLQYYYMGFYIHSCPKMRYKGSYAPSFILCPETYIFQPIEKCIPKLNISKYSRLEEDTDKVDPDGDINIDEVMVLYRRQGLLYHAYVQINPDADDAEQVQQYAGVVGKKCYRRMLLYRS